MEGVIFLSPKHLSAFCEKKYGQPKALTLTLTLTLTLILTLILTLTITLFLIVTDKSGAEKNGAEKIRAEKSRSEIIPCPIV